MFYFYKRVTLTYNLKLSWGTKSLSWPAHSPRTIYNQLFQKSFQSHWRTSVGRMEWGITAAPREAGGTKLHLYGEAGHVPAAGVCAVSPSPESSCTGALRCQHHVVVYPLTPFHEQVGQSGVQRDVVVVGEQHLLRHQSHLEKKRGEKRGQQTGQRMTESAASLLLEAGWCRGRCALGPSL